MVDVGPECAVEWRSLFETRRVEEPTYRREVVGPIERFDERDCLFARMDLEPGSERYEAYYRSHQEFQAADDFLRSMPPLGSTAAPTDAPLLGSLFGSALIAGRPMDTERSGGRTVGTGGSAAPVHLDPEEAALKVKAFARYLGADLVGIGPLNPAFVYSHVGRTFYGKRWGEEIHLDHPHAISLGIAMDYDLLGRHAPGFPVILESGLAYARAAFVAVQLALYIRGLGYSAQAHHLRDYQLLSVPVAIDAGLGELGRSGVLITREFGSSLRLATVTTDLPMALDRPVDLGIQEFCGSCKLCAMACPSGAIPQGDKMAVRGVRRWKLAAGRCYHYWRQVGSDCALCLVACSWSRPDNATRPFRPIHPEPLLDPATLARVAETRSTLPAWLRKYLG
ncbi:MAG: 4Fe-4S dicluster domain-containing protein [Chloroflexota bacterium]